MSARPVMTFSERDQLELLIRRHGFAEVLDEMRLHALGLHDAAMCEDEDVAEVFAAVEQQIAEIIPDIREWER